MIAERMALLDSSGIRKVFDLAAKLENPVNLSIGQPDFDVPGPVKDAAVRAIREGRNRYTVTQGTAELREALRGFLREKKGVEADGLLVTSGVSGALVLAFLTLVGPGDEVVCPDPYFVMYKSLIQLAQGTPVFADTYPDFVLTADRIRECLTDRTKMVLLNSPGNPTGAIIPPGEVEKIAALAAERDLLLLSDEIYDGFAYDGECPSVAALHPKTLLTGGFSKSHAMTGWRLGYLAGPAGLVDKMTMLQQYSFVCAPSFAQEAGLAALQYDTADWRDQYRKKRDRIYEGLRDAGYDVARPEGAFYIFPRCPWGTDGEFVAEAIKRNLLIIPGSVFSEKNTHFRISYAASDENIEKGIEILAGLVRG